MSPEMVKLDVAERKKFSRYCLWEAHVANGMAKMMEEHKIPEVVITHEKAKAAAYLYVGTHLGSMEEMTIGGG